MTAHETEILLREAARLRDSGPIEEAIAAHERLLTLRPKLAESWYDLAYLQRKARRFEASLESYRQALDHGVSGPEEVHVNRAVILAHLDRTEAALEELAAALRVSADFLPALLNLGALQEDLGRRNEARQTYERVLAVDPHDALALARLAGLVEISGPGDPIIARLRGEIARPGASAVDQASLGFALGQTLDAAGDYEAAFAAYTAANVANRASLGPTAPRYDRIAHEAWVDRLIAAFPDCARREETRGDEPPIFICGMFRSGSTLTERILAAHSRVASGGELDLIPALVRTELQPYPEAAAAADRQTLAQLRTAYLDGLRAIHPEGGRITDKRPDNFLHIGLIKALFPTAKIIHTVRNPLDNCLSIYFLHLHPRMTYGHDLADIAHWYGQYGRLMSHWKALYPADIHDLDYDALVADPRPTVEALLDFCGLEWEEACLDFHKADSIVKTASVWQVRQPLYAASSGRWKNYDAHLGALRTALTEGADGGSGA